MQFLHLLFSVLFCLRVCGQQMFFGFGTEGVKVSLWGLEDVHIILMGQHLHKFVSDVGYLLLKCHIVLAHTCFQETSWKGREPCILL